MHFSVFWYNTVLQLSFCGYFQWLYILRCTAVKIGSVLLPAGCKDSGRETAGRGDGRGTAGVVPRGGSRARTSATVGGTGETTATTRGADARTRRDEDTETDAAAGWASGGGGLQATGKQQVLLCPYDFESFSLLREINTFCLFLSALLIYFSKVSRGEAGAQKLLEQECLQAGHSSCHPSNNVEAPKL